VAILAILGKLVALILEVYKGPILAITLKDDAAALATIATIGTTKGHELLATEVTRACATVTRASKYLNVIYKVASCHTSTISAYTALLPTIASTHTA
jgi:hypothetical protein